MGKLTYFSFPLTSLIKKKKKRKGKERKYSARLMITKYLLLYLSIGNWYRMVGVMTNQFGLKEATVQLQVMVAVMLPLLKPKVWGFLTIDTYCFSTSVLQLWHQLGVPLFSSILTLCRVINRPHRFEGSVPQDCSHSETSPQWWELPTIP